MITKKRKTISKLDEFRFGGPKRPYFELFTLLIKFIPFDFPFKKSPSQTILVSILMQEKFVSMIKKRIRFLIFS